MEALVCSGRLMPGCPSGLILTPPAVVRTTPMLTWLLPCCAPFCYPSLRPDDSHELPDDPRSPATLAELAFQALDHSQPQSLWELENGAPPFSLPTLHRAWLPSLANSVFNTKNAEVSFWCIKCGHRPWYCSLFRVSSQSRRLRPQSSDLFCPAHSTAC